MIKFKIFKLFLVFIILILTITIISGCKNNNKNTQTKEIVLGQAKTQNPLDATRSTHDEPKQIVGNIFEGMLEIDTNTGELVPCLAEEMPTISKDGLEYTFKLKQGVKFHDGSKLTANDVKFSVERILTPSTCAHDAEDFTAILGAREMLNGNSTSLKGAQVLDDYTIKFILDSRFSLFLYYIGPMAVIPEKTCKNSSGWEVTTVVGTGPFKLEELDAKTNCKLVKFSEYHGQKPKIDGILFKFYDDTSTLLMDYEAKNVDIMFLSDTDAEIYEKNPNFSPQVHSIKAYGHSFINLNVKKEPWNNIKVREAFSYAIDKEAIANDLYGGRSVAAGCLINPNLLGHDKNVLVKEYDPAKSKQILKEAGFERPLKIDLYVSNSTYVGGSKLAPAIQIQAKQAGFDINIIQTDTAARREMMEKGNLSFAIISWILDSPEADGLLYGIFHSKNSPRSASGYKNKDYDNLVEKARKTLDKADRAEIYRQADKKLVQEDFAVIPIGYPRHYYMIQPWIKNFSADYWILSFNKCYIERA